MIWFKNRKNYDETRLNEMLNNVLWHILSGRYYNAAKELAYAMGMAGFKLRDDISKAIRIPDNKMIESFLNDSKLAECDTVEYALNTLRKHGWNHEHTCENCPFLKADKSEDGVRNIVGSDESVF